MSGMGVIDDAYHSAGWMTKLVDATAPKAQFPRPIIGLLVIF